MWPFRKKIEFPPVSRCANAGPTPPFSFGRNTALGDCLYQLWDAYWGLKRSVAELESNDPARKPWEPPRIRDLTDEEDCCVQHLRSCEKVGWETHPRTHELKTTQPHYAALERGVKRFEIRREDRGFKVGDKLVLAEYDPNRDHYTGERQVRWICHMTSFKQRPGYVVLGLARYDEFP